MSSRPSSEGAVSSIAETLKGYFAAPLARSGRGMGIVVVPDCGPAAACCRYVVDHLATEGFEAVSPQLFDEAQAIPTDGAEEDWLQPLLPHVEASVAALRKKGCVRFGLVGFGRGGRVAEASSALGQIAATVSVRGFGHSAGTYSLAKGSILYVAAAEDECPDKPTWAELRAAGANTILVEANVELLDVLTKTFSKACLRKATFVKVGTLHPDAKGLNVLLKVLTEPKEAPSAAGRFFEVTCGDETAQVVLSLQEGQLNGIQPNKVLAARNASIRMVQGFMRLVVDKWGKLDLDVTDQIHEIGKKNLSEIEYELLRP